MSNRFQKFTYFFFHNSKYLGIKSTLIEMEIELTRFFVSSIDSISKSYLQNQF